MPNDVRSRRGGGHFLSDSDPDHSFSVRADPLLSRGGLRPFAISHNPSVPMIPIAHGAVDLLLLLLAGHALGDYAFQSSFLAEAKNRHTRIGRECWVAALPAHALIHGVLVFAVTRSVALGLAETVAHGIIDWCKNEGWFGFRVDQGLHALCKILWLVLVLHR
jgi:hypothetical protein